MQEFQPGDHAILIGTKGRYGFSGPTQRAGAVPDHLSITQDGLPINVTGAFAATPLDTVALPKGLTWTVLKIGATAGFDPAHPSQISMRITRKNSEIYPRRKSKEFPVAFQAPAAFFDAPEVKLEGWQAVWHGQRYQIGLTLASLLVLAGALGMPQRLTQNTTAFTAFRMLFLAVTLAGIGWWGQGQLSINNILGVINAAKTNGNFNFLLYDPVSLLLWAFVLVSLIVFGRGTFCGWLCPFGALQEFSAADRRQARHQADHHSLCHRPQAAPREVRRVGIDHRRCVVCNAGCRVAGGDRTLQDLDHAGLRPKLAVRDLRGRARLSQHVRVQGLLPLPVSAGRGSCPARPGAGLRLDPTAQGVRFAVPVVHGSLPLWRHRADRQGEVRRMLPLHGLRRHLPQRQDMRAARPGAKGKGHAADGRPGAPEARAPTGDRAMRERDLRPSRRQVLIAGGIAGGALCLSGAGQFTAPAGMKVAQRSGVAFGTIVKLKAAHADASTLDRALDAAWQEIVHVEEAASLYRTDSAISILNRTGEIAAPPAALMDLVEASLELALLTDGAFDPTVQPLWKLYADAFAAGRSPTLAELEGARALVGWRGIAVSGGHIRLLRPGMAMTLNGVAQGYATQKCLEALAAHGVANAFLNTGELGIAGTREDHSPWTAGIADPRHQGDYAAVAKPRHGILATSGDYATAWTADFAQHHILDPKTLRSPGEMASVSVLAPSGALADGLATAMMVMGHERALTLAKRLSGVEVFLIAKSGARFMSPGFPLA